MVVGEFTASAIAMEEDKREEEEQAKKDSTVDYAKLEADIAANKTLAAQVSPGCQASQRVGPGRRGRSRVLSAWLCRSGGSSAGQIWRADTPGRQDAGVRAQLAVELRTSTAQLAAGAGFGRVSLGRTLGRRCSA